ncbi:MAG TPA: hypothetical protein GXX49_10055 [Clostridiaceae bacterium]|nr:hypothetical protein [Clostridiaceae bacterium]
MTVIFKKYKLIILVVCLLIIAFTAWLIAERVVSNKIPSRGVFVNEDCMEQSAIANEKT